MEEHAATRWLVVLGAPLPARSFEFLWDRVTPGGTFGLEFTSLMAVLAVAALRPRRLHRDRRRRPGPDPGRRNRDRTRRTPADAAGSPTSPRSSPSSAPASSPGALTAVCAALLAARRRWAEFGVLLAGMAIVPIGVARDQGRGRPAAARRRALVAASGSSFPSGHAAYSVLYVWLAVTIVLRLRPGMARGAAVVVDRDRADRRWSASPASTSTSTTSATSAPAGRWAPPAFSFCAAVGARHHPKCARIHASDRSSR